jgi:hypothetical protein
MLRTVRRTPTGWLTFASNKVSNPAADDFGRAEHFTLCWIDDGAFAALTQPQ